MIENFYNIHKNEDVYVLGSGKSLDFISSDFFKDKITIGINRVGEILKAKYIIAKDKKSIDYLIGTLKNEQILFISKGNFGENNEINKNYIQLKYKENKQIIIFNHEKNNHDIKSLPEKNKLVVSRSTITSGIHLAAYMGAKSIILVGHDCGFLNNEFTCKNYYQEEKNRKVCWDNFEDYFEWLSLIENDTIQLKKMIKNKYNCNIYSLNPFINFNLEGSIYKKKYNKIL